MDRKKVANAIWKATHRDFKGKRADGTRVVLYAGPHGTTSCPIEALPEEVFLDYGYHAGAVSAAELLSEAAAVELASLAERHGEKLEFELWCMREALPGGRCPEALKMPLRVIGSKKLAAHAAGKEAA